MQRPAIHGAASLLLVAAVAGAAGVWSARSSTPIPIHFEEFSHLLAADTFARGRLANRTPESWIHLEAPHVLQKPTYVSKHPPLQGLVLALGLVLGDPLRGALLAYAAACAAVCWMLRAWLPAAWALAGGVLLAVHPQMVASWGAGFAGASAGLAGGALVYGAAVRLRRRPRARDGLWLGVGVSALALSQPYEGAVACLPAAWWLARGPRRDTEAGARGALARGLLPAALVSATALAFLGYYHHRTTGSVFTSPARLYDQSYSPVPAFLFQPRPPPVEYHNEVFEEIYHEQGREVRPYLARRTWSGFWRGSLEKFASYWRFYALIAFSASALALPWALRDPPLRFALAALGWFGLALWVQTHESPTFAAPFLALATFVFVALLRRICALRVRELPVGPLLAAVIVAVGLEEHSRAALRTAEQRELTDLVDRPQIADQMARHGGRHLVFVGYGRGHHIRSEWVYNPAEIETARILWVRQRSQKEDRELAQRFSDRRIWVLQSVGGRVRILAHPKTRRWKGREPTELAPGGEDAGRGVS